MAVSKKDLKTAKKNYKIKSGKALLKPKVSFKVLLLIILFAAIAGFISLAVIFAYPIFSSVLAGVMAVDTNNQLYIMISWGLMSLIGALLFYRATVRLLKVIWQNMVRKPHQKYVKERDEYNAEVLAGGKKDEREDDESEDEKK